MNHLSESEIAKRLRRRPRPEPPPDLLPGLIEDIPHDLGQGGRHSTLWWVAAALIISGMAVTWSFLAHRAETTAKRETPFASAPTEVASESRPPQPAPNPEPEPESEPDVRVRDGAELPRPPVAEETTVSGPPGSISVAVRDLTGTNLPGVVVTVESETLKGDARHMVLTDPGGVARVPDLEPGAFTVRAEMPLLANFTWDDVTVNAGEERELRTTLMVISHDEIVNVTGTSPVVEVATVGHAAVFSEYLKKGAYDHVYFEHYGVHPFVDTEDDFVSTFALDVDTASYTIARRFLGDGNLPDPDSIRVEEFLNFFDYGDPAPTDDDFAVHLESAPSPFATTARTWLLRVGLNARTIEPAERRPAVLTFLVDVSGSMAEENRLELVKRGLNLLVGRLRDDDRIGLVVFGPDASVLHEPSRDHEALIRTIERLQPDGSTNLGKGLQFAYEAADRAFMEGATNRVILCSDGVANRGDTAWEALLEKVSQWTERGIEITAIGFGMGNYNDVLMEQLADHADGRYAYIDTYREAKRIFEHQLTSTLETVARDAKLQVAFEPRVVRSFRLLGYENRDIADADFRDDDVDAGEIGAGHHVTALYEVKLRERKPTGSGWANVKLRYARASDGEVIELGRDIAPHEVAASWKDASAALRLASIVAEFADVLRGSHWARETSLEAVFLEAQQIQEVFPGRTDVAELASLIGQAVELRQSENDTRR